MAWCCFHKALLAHLFALCRLISIEGFHKTLLCSEGHEKEGWGQIGGVRAPVITSALKVLTIQFSLKVLLHPHMPNLSHILCLPFDLHLNSKNMLV